MKRVPRMRRIIGFIGGLVVLAVISGMAACQLDVTGMPGIAAVGGQEAAPAPQSANDLVIENDSRLPDTHPREFYQVRFHRTAAYRHCIGKWRKARCRRE